MFTLANKSIQREDLYSSRGVTNKVLNPSVENIRRGTMAFSQIDRYPSITNVTATKLISKYDMIQHIQHIKPCGKCHGAK